MWQLKYYRWTEGGCHSQIAKLGEVLIIFFGLTSFSRFFGEFTEGFLIFVLFQHHSIVAENTKFSFRSDFITEIYHIYYNK